MLKEINCTYIGSNGRKSLYDLTVPHNWNGKIILFAHGYMGFKDWGCWGLVEQFFVDNSYGFVKYNVSHNGGTIDTPIDFPDTDAFSNNSYTKELYDFEQIISLLESRIVEFDLYTIGHSRGGGIIALQSGHPNVTKWSSWAGICDIVKRFPAGDILQEWKENTYRFVKNGRTHQDMPHHFDQFLDYQNNAQRLDIKGHCLRNEKPCFILHGAEDMSVLLDEGRNLARWTDTDLYIIQGTQHTFGSSHPWKEDEMPAPLREACEQTLLFFGS